MTPEAASLFEYLFIDPKLDDLISIYGLTRGRTKIPLIIITKTRQISISSLEYIPKEIIDK